MSGIREPWRSTIIIAMSAGFGISPAYHWGGTTGAVVLACFIASGIVFAILTNRLDARARTRRAAQAEAQAAAPAFSPADNHSTCGWYIDPTDPAKTQMRYWNGTAWTEPPDTP